jgi:uncharacterized cupredoxin-like copper-binding protein
MEEGMTTAVTPPTADDDKLPPFRARDISTPLIFFAAFVFLCLTIAIGVTTARSGDDSATPTAAGVPLTAHVALSEFKLDPSSVSVAKGGVLHVQNDGTTAHNLSVVDTDLTTPDLASGDATELDISSLKAGSYQILCLIPGHADAGMKGTLQVVDEGNLSAAGKGSSGSSMGSMDMSGSGSSTATTMDYKKMTQDMLSSVSKFPAATKGVGNQPLAPTEVRADGTKVFDLDMKIADWEVSPGKVVKAWTFNGMVPGPQLDLQVGDKVEIRVRNDLPIATDVHLHGINVDNKYDGVAPLTQPIIEPGQSFTYKFTADEVAVAMYHPHAHGHLLLPDGMFGVIEVGQPPLPAGRTVGGHAVPADVKVSQRIPMVLNDAGVIGYSLNGKSFPATAPVVANVGDWILIDYFNEGTQIHPMHLHQFDQIVVAEDGFTLDSPYLVDTLSVAPGERYTVLVHIDKPGTWVWHCHILPHVESTAGMFGMVTAVVAK